MVSRAHVFLAFFFRITQDRLRQIETSSSLDFTRILMIGILEYSVCYTSSFFFYLTLKSSDMTIKTDVLDLTPSQRNYMRKETDVGS